MKNKKISIVIPCYNTEKYVERCLDSLINQTYKNLEIIVVNDCSPGNLQEILEKYIKEDNRIKVVNHEKNRGLFQARISGSEVATGDYIAFVDSDDYVELDFYRELLSTLENTTADMVICNTVQEGTERYIYNFFKTGKTELRGEEILEEYFKQEGKNYRWHTVWNKLYSMELWKKSYPYYKKITKHLIMTEDFVFSTVLFSHAKKLVYNDRANYFYCSNEEASTNVEKIKYKKAEKNISDIIMAFDFVKDYLKISKLWNQYKENYNNWKLLYTQIWHNHVVNSDMSEEEQKKLLELLHKFCSKYEKVEIDNTQFYSVTTPFNDKLLAMKDEIINHDIISFDVFDTLVVRPFYEPIDLFKFLNRKYMEIFNKNGLLEFSTIRQNAERECRDFYYKKKIKEVNLDQIYDYIHERYELDKKKLEELKKLEIELEIRFCTRRETAYSLYCLARQLGKKVIVTSDMYLSKEVIQKILEKNGYNYFDEYYISNEYNKTKWTGELFEVIKQDDNLTYLHIGDNIESDVVSPKKFGFDSYYFPKPITVFMNYSSEETCVNYCGRLFENLECLHIDYGNYREFLGNRCSIGIVANKFFDNPFVSFNSNTDFNCDANFVGYYALGMHILAMTKWLLDDMKEKSYDSISFMARDGYLPYLAAKEMLPLYGIKNLKLNYTYLSRKSLFPLNIKTFTDLYKFKEYFFLDSTPVNKIIKLLSYVLELPDDYEDILKKNGFSKNKLLLSDDEYYQFMKFVFDNFYSKKKYEKYVEIAKEYFSNEFSGKAATFDIGYSGQPELILSDLLQKPIDTYFIHTNTDSGFRKSNYGNYKLKCFYPFKPTFTGTLREYIISSTGQSCIGYKKEKEVIPLFENKKIYDYFDLKILEEIQNGCVQFVKDFCEIFKEDIFDIELNNFYMSTAYEYFLAYSKPIDRLIFKGLKFEDNVGREMDILDFWDDRFKEYNTYYNSYGRKNGHGLNHYNMFLENRVLNRNRFVRVLFFLVYDRYIFKEKLKSKLKRNGILYKVSRKLYRSLKHN